MNVRPQSQRTDLHHRRDRRELQNPEEAKSLVDAAGNCGLDAVKLQTFRANTLASSAAEFHFEATGDVPQLELFRDYEFLEALHREIFQYIDGKGLDWFHTPSHGDDLVLLESLGVGKYPIGSDDLTNLPFLEAVARTGKPVLLSTGMSTLPEVEEGSSSTVSLGSSSAADAPEFLPSPFRGQPGRDTSPYAVTMVEIPPLDTERSTLRGYATADFADCFAMWSDPQVTASSAAAPPLPRRCGRASSATSGTGRFSASATGRSGERASGRFVGDVGFADFRPTLRRPSRQCWRSAGCLLLGPRSRVRDRGGAGRDRPGCRATQQYVMVATITINYVLLYYQQKALLEHLLPEIYFYQPN